MGGGKGRKLINVRFFFFEREEAFVLIVNLSLAVVAGSLGSPSGARPTDRVLEIRRGEVGPATSTLNSQFPIHNFSTMVNNKNNRKRGEIGALAICRALKLCRRAQTNCLQL